MFPVVTNWAGTYQDSSDAITFYIIIDPVACRYRKEFHTRERLIEEIEKMGVPYEKLPGTGLIAIIEGGKPGKNKILRADIDALPLQEETE